MTHLKQCTSTKDCKKLLQAWRQDIDQQLLEQLQLHLPHTQHTARIQPQLQTNKLSISLHSAMQYSLVKNGGHRWRPLLLYVICDSLGANLQTAKALGAAVECIHAYSLIHDDLPAMDDDDYRRNQPSCHRAFDEATAILAGDSLSNLAFSILSQSSVHCTPKESARYATQRLKMIACLAQASGAAGMAYGQALDLAAANTHTDGLAYKDLKTIHYYKTGCLFAASCQLASIHAGHDQTQQNDFYQLGMHIGQAYQIHDDLQDAQQDQANKALNITQTNKTSQINQDFAQLKIAISTKAKYLLNDSQLIETYCSQLLST